MDTEVAIVGSGPNGLSVAAHLAHAGVEARIFGPPMDSWRNHMPAGMLLKSDGFATNLSAPVTGWTLREYCEREGVPYAERGDWPRNPLTNFIQYGLAFQQHFAPELDQRLVTHLDRTPEGFALGFDDGTTVTAKRVVLAVGITHFAVTPATLQGIGDRVTTADAHRTFEDFSGKRVAVIGAGSSAVGVAAALVDAGAAVSLLARGTEVRFWNTPDLGAPPPAPPSLRSQLRYPSSVLGPGWPNRLCQELPDGFRHLPAGARRRIVANHLGPESPWWLKERVVGGADVRTQTRVTRARSADETVALTINDATGNSVELYLDHVICGTGYRADIDRLRFLQPALRSSLRRVGAMPVLTRHFESSVPGLYFTGTAASGSFGPLMRFVAGSEFTAPRVASNLIRQFGGRSGRRFARSLAVK